jgi:hypothetical protein
MAEEGRGVALAILGVVALIAVVGLVLLFRGATGNVVAYDPIYGSDKLYGGWDRVQENAPRGSVGEPYAGSWVKGVPTTWEGQTVGVIGGSQARYRVPSSFTTCPAGQIRVGARGMDRLTDDEFATCVPSEIGDGSYCCEIEGLSQHG